MPEFTLRDKKKYKDVTIKVEKFFDKCNYVIDKTYKVIYHLCYQQREEIDSIKSTNNRDRLYETISKEDN